jgi:hypothetical protein
MNSLSTNSINDIIDNVLLAESTNNTENSTTISNRRLGTSEDWQSIIPSTTTTGYDHHSNRPPFYFGFQSIITCNDTTTTTTTTTSDAFCTFYLGYSTWDGRMLIADQVVAGTSPTSNNNHNETTKFLKMFQILARIAVQLGCARLADWKVRW